MKTLASIFAIVLASCSAQEPAPSEPPPEEPAGAVEDCRAEVLCETRTVRPGTQASVGVLLKLAPHHHVYWKNPGDSGLAPSVTWTLPAGWSAGPLAWPAPRRLVSEGIIAYAYEDEVLFPVTLTIPADAAPGETLVSAKVEWLVCSADACVPGEALCEIRLAVADAVPEADPRRAAAFAKARAELPKPLPAGSATLDTSGGSLALLVEGIEISGASVEFYPAESLLLEELEPAVVVRGKDGRARIELTQARRRTEPVDRLSGVLVVRTEKGTVTYEIDAVNPERR